MARVGCVKRWVRRLLNENHPLPPAEAREVDPLLPAGAVAWREELALLLPVKAVPAHELLLVFRGWRTQRMRHSRGEVHCQLEGVRPRPP